MRPSVQREGDGRGTSQISSRANRSLHRRYLDLRARGKGANVANVAVAREIVGFCSEHFAEELSLEMLESELHLSKYYISHLFSGKLGIRFNDYINSLRISHACRLLRREDMQITEIAGLVGFEDPFYFSRIFARHIGCSPKAYRKR